MGMIVAMGIFFIVITMAFVAVAYFLPEWLGITGRKAKEVIAEQAKTSLQEPEIAKSPLPQKEE